MHWVGRWYFPGGYINSAHPLAPFALRFLGDAFSSGGPTTWLSTHHPLLFYRPENDVFITSECWMLPKSSRMGVVVFVVSSKNRSPEMRMQTHMATYKKHEIHTPQLPRHPKPKGSTGIMVVSPTRMREWWISVVANVAMNSAYIVDTMGNTYLLCLMRIFCRGVQSHSIHGTGIFTYVCHKNQPNVR